MTEKVLTFLSGYVIMMMIKHIERRNRMIIDKRDKLVVSSDDITADLSYARNDKYIHLTLWKGDMCLDRVSLPLDKVVKKLSIPFITKFIDTLIEIEKEA